MKRRALIVMLSLVWTTTAQAAIVQLVTSVSDEPGEGTLRTVLQAACDEPDDNLILFDKTRLAELRIHLLSPLVIPEDCQGTVTLEGSSQVETILDASMFAPETAQPGDLCTLNIYSDGHTIRNATWVGNMAGAGICLFGRHNTVLNNRFDQSASQIPEPNRYGVVIYDIFRRTDNLHMDGSFNAITENQFALAEHNAIWVHANQATIVNNQINGSGDHGIVLRGDGHQLRGNTMSKNHGAGIYVEAPSQAIVIGGEHAATDRNLITKNGAGGVVLADDDSIAGVRLTHNRIFDNQGKGVGIDLGADGVSPNDIGDADIGPNRRFNQVEHLHVISLTENPQGPYWAWGVAFDAAQVELFRMAAIDVQNNLSHAGGNAWMVDAAVHNDTFEIAPQAWSIMPNATLTTLAFDHDDNTSEYGQNTPVGPDADGDGIPNALEKNDTEVVATGIMSSDPNKADTDDDGLPDSVEDRNRNGVWNPQFGETVAYIIDTDNDGVSDYYELHGDGDYDPSVDTNPLVADTDGDSLRDGAEDTNGNGIWDAYLGESNPRAVDSDQDGFPDSTDACPGLYDPTQEPWFCAALSS